MTGCILTYEMFSNDFLGFDCILFHYSFPPMSAKYSYILSTKGDRDNVVPRTKPATLVQTIMIEQYE